MARNTKASKLEPVLAESGTRFAQDCWSVRYAHHSADADWITFVGLIARPPLRVPSSYAWPACIMHIGPHAHGRLALTAAADLSLVTQISRSGRSI